MLGRNLAGSGHSLCSTRMWPRFGDPVYCNNVPALDICHFHFLCTAINVAEYEPSKIENVQSCRNQNTPSSDMSNIFDVEGTKSKRFREVEITFDDRRSQIA